MEHWGNLLIKSWEYIKETTSQLCSNESLVNEEEEMEVSVQNQILTKLARHVMG